MTTNINGFKKEVDIKVKAIKGYYGWVEPQCPEVTYPGPKYWLLARGWGRGAQWERPATFMLCWRGFPEYPVDHVVDQMNPAWSDPSGLLWMMVGGY